MAKEDSTMQENERITSLKEMLIKEPKDSFLAYALALEFVKIGGVNDSILLMEKIILNEPTYLPVYYQLGKLYESINDKLNASSAYKKGIELAKTQKKQKAINELNEALILLEEA